MIMGWLTGWWRVGLADEVSIGLLATVFPDELVVAAVEEAGVGERRKRALPARLMVYFALALWLDFGKGYVRVLTGLLTGLRWARGGWGGYVVPTDGAISLARGRLGDKPLRLLFDQTARPVGRVGMEGVFWRGRRLVATDGTVFDLPRGKKNAAEYAVPAGGVLPQARLVALAECGTLALLGAELDSIAVGERALFERLLPRLGPGMLLLADRGFPSYGLYVKALATGADVLWRVSASFSLPVLQRVTDGTYLSELRGARKKDRVTVRVIECSVCDDDGVSEVFALVTNLLDPEEAPALELARNYAERWHIELLFRLVKADLRTPGGILRSRSPQGVRQEIWALLCLYQALRTLITRAALITGTDPTRISFPPALDAVKDSVARAFPPPDLATALRFFLTDIPSWVIRHRPNRKPPVKTIRPSLRYTTRSTTDPGTRLVTRTIELHLLPPEPLNSWPLGPLLTETSYKLARLLE